MSTATINYFHSVSLRQRFLEALDDAVHAGHVTVQERVWLQCITHDPDEHQHQHQHQHEQDPCRVDRLVFSDAAPRPFELAAALMLSHVLTDLAPVYLYTLASGLQVFDSRSALLSALRERFAQGDVNRLFEYEKIDGDPFKAQMFAIVDHQVDQVRQLAVQLRLTPSLSDASTASLTLHLHGLLPHMPVDPATHVLQIAPIDDGNAEPDLVVQTLVQAALDDSCKVHLAEGYERRFLDAQGLLATTADSALLHQAFAAAQAGLGECHRQLLSAFWSGRGEGTGSRRGMAIDSLTASLLNEVHEQSLEGTLHADDRNALLPLLNATSAASASADLRCHRLQLRVGEGGAAALAGTFLVKPTSDAVGQLMWFAPDHRLHLFADLAALTVFLATPLGRDRLRPALALADQPMLDGEGTLQIELEDILVPLWADRVDSIIALQARNLTFAMRMPCLSEKRTAMIDDALDVRLLLDPRQLAFGAGRWCEGEVRDFASVWLTRELAHETASDTDPTPVAADGENDAPGPIRSLSASWTEFTQAFDARAEHLRQFESDLEHTASQALQRYLCVLFKRPVRASDLHAQWLESVSLEEADVESHSVTVSESLQVEWMPLLALLLENVTRHRPTSRAANTQIKWQGAAASAHLETDLIAHLLAGAAKDFETVYLAEFRRARKGTQRQADQQWRVGKEALSLREDAMRLDLSLAKRQARIDSTAVTLARQVLDRPVRGLRLALGGPVTEAYSLALACADLPGAVLSDTLVLKQPLEPDGPILLWSCEFGWRQFASMSNLETTLQFNLRNENRERWLTLMAEGERRALRAHLLNTSDNEVRVELTRIDGHVTQVMQDCVLDQQQRDLRHVCKRAVRCGLEAGLFTRLAKSVELDGQLISLLDGLSVRIDNSIFEAMLPPWVSVASLSELMEYYNIFKHYFLVSADGKDFLFGVPTLQDLARERLTETLKRDFPTHTFDPKRITVTSRRYVTAFPAAGELPSGVPAATEVRTESLIDYAINRFIDAQDSALSVQSAADPHAAAVLTPDYLRSLIREVDVGEAYMAVLRKAFSPTDPHFAERKRLFFGQLPSALMAVALPEKVLGRLSATAYQFIARLFDMPDGIAREPINDTWVILSPLQLVADEGMTPDPVTGMYLICPAAPDAGPVVLYAVYHPEFVIREYANREALLTAIRTDASLQQLLLERLNPDVHRRYAHGGFVEPHLPFSVEGFNDLPVRAPGPVTLGIAEVKGNVLQTFFDGTVKLLIDMGRSNAVTNAQADHVGRTFLATLALSQALTLLPSKLAALITVWQSHTLLRASAASASRHHWGQALSEFTSALGLMVTAKEQSLEEQPPEELNPSPALIADEEFAASSFSWGETTLTPEQRVRLQGLEAQNVALAEMRHDELLNLYFDSDDAMTYAVVAGRVYHVKQLANQGDWIIVGSDGAYGPQILLDNRQQWQLDLSLRLRGGGGAVTRYLETAVAASAESCMVVEATGMPEIRKYYRYRARRIGEAHMQAKQYLENSLDNLNAVGPDGTLDPRVQRIIGDFFGTALPDQPLLTRIEHAVKTLFDAVMDPSLSPFSSTRFVIGTNRVGRGHVTAFVIPQDPQKRVFLTDRFFRPPRFHLKPEAAMEGFETTAHFQASTLLHELSHLVLNTKDIAYLESNAPFPDLLREDTAANVRMHAQIERMQDYRFSHRTPKNDLFTQEEDGHWRDVRREDALGYSTILRITGVKTLDEARTVFLTDVDKRSQIMLKNADSVGLLILRLGRHNVTAIAP